MVEQSLDRVACRLVSTYSCDCNNEWFSLTEDEFGEVAMSSRGAIAGFRVAKLSGLSAWTAVVGDIDEIKPDDSRVRTEDHPYLLSEDVGDNGFEVICWNGVQLFEHVIVGVLPRVVSVTALMNLWSTAARRSV